jgi:hypothetical protein
MVNLKNSPIFKVNKQTPTKGPPPQAYSTVINCRQSGSKRAATGDGEVRTKRVRLSKVPGSETPELDRGWKRDSEDNDHASGQSEGTSVEGTSADGTSNAGPLSTVSQGFALSRKYMRPTKFRRGKSVVKNIDLDCWFTILSFSDPAQLLEMRTKIASCYRFLRDNPKLWNHSRTYFYRDSLPDPPSELTEFQYAHLRHGQGCMSCGTRSTRKTYWAFLRRWCKTCIQAKTIKENDALLLFPDANGEDISYIQKCLPAGIFDSWGNFNGVGPASTHSLKTVYLKSDVDALVAEYIKESGENRESWHAEMRTWITDKAKVVEERRQFAHKMELWEESKRQSKAFDYHAKKQARKKYFTEKAMQMDPRITADELKLCPAYRRAVAIPKDPNNASWLQLKPKIEKEVADLLGKERAPMHPPINSMPGTQYDFI